MRVRLFSMLLTFCGMFHAFTFTNDVPLWMHDQISEDLKPFSEGIKKTEISQFFDEQTKPNNRLLLIKFTIKNNSLTVTPAPSGSEIRVSHTATAISEILKRAQLPDMEFIITMHDALDREKLSVPVFAFAKNPSEAPNIVLMPDFEALSGNAEVLKEVEIGASLYPWHKKRNVAVWRGATTGGIFTKDNFLEFPRSQMITMSLKYPKLINARYTSLVQCNDCDEVKRRYTSYFGDSFPVRDHLRCKYQLLVDGNTCAYARAYWQLFSQCVVFKQESPAVQWYYRCLQPYVHYVPIKKDLSDLHEAVAWAINHDKECLEISKRAYDFASSNITHSRVLQYLYLLLLEYSKLCRA
jgi:hypothetical protein